MKKILSILFISIFLSQNVIWANTIQNPAVINCSQSTDNFCNSIEISKEPLKLKSNLKKDYSAYMYSIMNTQETPIQIQKIGSQADPSLINFNIGVNYGRMMERFPIIIAYPILGTVFLPWLVVGKVKDEPGTIGYLLYDIYIMPVKNTVLAPYYWIKDPIDDKKAYKEVSLFKKDLEKITLNKNEKNQFAVLVNKNKHKSRCNEKISIQINDTKTGKTYIIEK